MTLLLDLGWLQLALFLVFTPVSVGVCLSSEFTCTEGVCVPAAHVCDFTDNCEDGRDEEDCE